MRQGQESNCEIEYCLRSAEKTAVMSGMRGLWAVMTR